MEKAFLAIKLSIVKQNRPWFNTNSLFVYIEKKIVSLFSKYPLMNIYI